MEFLIVASAHFLALLSPGPDFFLIMQVSLRLPLRFGVAVSCGIAVANGVYLSFAVLGLEVIKNMVWLMIALKYLGACYLLFVGIMLLRTARWSVDDREPQCLLHIPSLRHQFVIGFMSAILNPKNAIFYLSLFTVMVSVFTPLAIRTLYALWMMTIVFLWDCLLVLVIGQDRVKDMIGKSVFYVDKLAGLVLALFGLMLPFV